MSALSLVQIIRKKWGDDVVNAARELEERVGFPKEVAERVARGDLDDSAAATAAELGDRLYTFHNLSVDNLYHADRMGGMPMPSVGVTRVDTPLQGYGDIELIGPQSMARPAAKNPVFSSDAYSPTYPRVNYRFKDENLGVLIDDLAPYTARVDDQPIKPYMDMEDQLLNLGSRKDVLAKYLDERGIDLPDDLEDAELHTWMLKQVTDGNSYGSPGSRSFDYDRYVRELFESLDAEERIFFGYTPSGNRRYKPHTLDNALKYMKEEMRDNNQTSMFGTGAFRAQVAPRFRTINDVKDARNRITQPGVLKDTKEALTSDFLEVSGEFADYAAYTDRNPFIAGDMHRDQLLEIAQGRGTYEEYFPGAPDELIQRWETWLQDLKEAPTAYFEAKPQRVVELNEFEGAIIPEDMPAEVEELLRKNGIDRVERAGNESERLAVMRKFQDVLFGAGGTAVGAGVLASGQSEEADAGFITKGGRELLEAWHGSPYKFDRFSMDQIGTGEGAQAYGHGLYFADRPEVGNSYKDVLALNNYQNNDQQYSWALDLGLSAREFDLLEMMVKAEATEGGYDPKKVSHWLQGITQWPDDQMPALEGFVNKYIDSLPKGHLYRAEIDATPQEFIRWDEPLEEESEVVRNILTPYKSDFTDTTGGALNLATDALGKGEPEGLLREAGLKGIKYHDGNSRGMTRFKNFETWLNDTHGMDLADSFGDPVLSRALDKEYAEYTQRYMLEQPESTYNYVIFDDGIINATHRDGVLLSR